MTTPHILYAGPDWLETSIKFENYSGLNVFLKDIERVFNAKPESRVSYLGKNWIVHPSEKYIYHRYLKDPYEGFTLYLDNRQNLGAAHSLRIVLGKPTAPNRGKLPPLWDKPFETMKGLINIIKGYYGEDIYHQISRVDLCVHFTNFKLEYQSYANFVTRLKPSVIPDRNSSDIYAIDSLSFGRVKKNNNNLFVKIYNVNKRLEERLGSFDPFGFYPSSYQNGDTVYNLEFRVWLRVLREFEIETIDDLEVKYKSLWVYLMTKRLSLKVANESDRKKYRWQTDPRWKALIDALGGAEPLQKMRKETSRMPIERKKKRTHTEITGYLADVDWHDLTLDERIERYLDEGGREAFTDEAIEKYRAKKGLQKVLRESSNG